MRDSSILKSLVGACWCGRFNDDSTFADALEVRNGGLAVNLKLYLESNSISLKTRKLVLITYHVFRIVIHCTVICSSTRYLLCLSSLTS